MGKAARMRRGRVTTTRETGTTQDAQLLQRPDASFLDTDPWRIVGHAVVLYSTEAMVPLVLLHPWCPLGKEPA